MKIQMTNLHENFKLINKNLKKNFLKLFSSQKFILGEEVQKLESNLSKINKVKYTLGVSSGTDAIIVALLACNIKKNDEVIIPDMTWISTASSVILLGAKPIMADVNLEDGTINIDSLKKKITKKTKAIISVSLYGHMPNLSKLKSICNKKKIHLINDGAQSFGSKHNNKYCHEYTSISCTSFFPAKVLGSYGDAGACFTNNRSLYEKMKVIRAHGQSKKSYSTTLGLNARIDTIQACVLIEKIKFIKKEIRRRSEIFKMYHNKLTTIKQINVLQPDQNCDANGSSVVILINNKKEFQNYMSSKGVQTANLYNYSITQQPTFKKYQDRKIKNSKLIAKNNVCLPIHPYMKNKEVDYVIECVKKYFKTKD
jgi:UDP-2-acetamido-2-deoxy-ribo-hexuluronate aminotransferase